MEDCVSDENYLLRKIENKLVEFKPYINKYEQIPGELYNAWDMCDFEVKNHLFVNKLGYYDSKIDTERIFEFYLNACQNDIGILFTEGFFDGKFAFNSSKLLVFYKSNYELINEFKDYVQQIHSYGTRVFFTIKPHIGRGIKDSKKIYNYSASFNKDYNDSNYICKRVKDADLTEIIEVSKNLADFSKAVGFDGIMIDASEFNILGEMINGEFNKRRFGYYYGTEVYVKKLIMEVNGAVGRCPIILKVTPHTLMRGLYGDKCLQINSIKRNVKQNTSVVIVDYLIELVKLGVDGYIFEFGTYETEFLSNTNMFIGENLFLDYYEQFKKCITECLVKNKYGQAVYLFYKGNVLFDKNIINAIDNNIISSVDITREYYSNSEFLSSKKAQRHTNICVKCCICNDYAEKFNKTMCLINSGINGAGLKKIGQFENRPIAIIGSGYSGLYSAIILTERGYIVDLYERENSLNLLGEKLKIFDFDAENVKLYNIFKQKMMEIAKNNKINIYCNNEFSVENNDYKYYKTIIVATGFKERFLGVPGAILKNVKSIYDTLNDKNELLSKKSIAILAKSELSIKLALYLKSENKNVSLIVPSFNLFKKLPNAKITYYAYLLSKIKMTTYIFAKVKRINEESVDIIVNNKLNNLDISTIILNSNSNIEYPYLAEEINIDADLFIYEPEIYSNNKLYYDLVKAGYDGELFIVGSALEIDSLASDLQSAFYVANNI